MEKELTKSERILRPVLRVLLVVAILGVGWGIARYWLGHRPTAERRPPVRLARFIEVRPVQSESRSVVIDAMGEVMPARQVAVAAEVAGRIVSMQPDLIPGGRFDAGQEMIRIDLADYQLALAQAQANLEVARAEMAQEMGRQEVALREFQLLGDDQMSPADRDLVLRRPQLMAAKAAVASAESKVAAADLDMSRTTVHAPFDCVVSARDVNVGARVNPGAVVADVVGVDVFWVDVSVPVDELHWIDIPGMNAETGSSVRIHHEAAWGEGVVRSGRVLRLRPGLETSGRMARLLIEVEDPLDIEKAVGHRLPLVLGAYVKVEIIGRTVPDVVSVDRENVHDGDTVWIMAEDDTLDIRPVEIVWSDEGHVYVGDGLAAGERLVVSAIAAPVAGMKLRTNGGDGASVTRSTGDSVARDKFNEHGRHEQ